MTSTTRLLVAQLARDRVTIPIWMLGISALATAAASAVSAEFAAESTRTAIVTVASTNPAFLFLRGAPDGTSLGAVVFFQAYSFMAVLAALMSTFFVVRHTRTDEELGRAELISAAPVRRSAALAATLLLGLTVNTALSILVAAGFAGAGLPVRGAVVAGLAVGAVGAVFVGLTAVLAQLVVSGRATNGLAAAAVGIAFLLRGIGDALGEPSADLLEVKSSWVSWLSPIGWAQRSEPFSEADVTRLLPHAMAAGALCVLALTIRQRRDLGWGLLSEGGGRNNAIVWGRTLGGLAWRLQRGTLLGWCVGAGVLGLIAGALGPMVADVARDNDSLTDLIGRLVPGNNLDIDDLFIAALLGIAGFLAAAAGVQAVQRLRAEEVEGHTESILATATSRSRLLLTSLAVAVVSVASVAVASGVAAGLTVAASSGDRAAVGVLTVASLAHVPAALVFVSITALVLATVPRATVLLGWGLLTLGLAVGQLGDLLRLPEWLQAVSPFHYSPATPVEQFDMPAALMLSAIAVALTVGATVIYRHRDLVP
jgi:ABC-2 type transport system permease protein